MRARVNHAGRRAIGGSTGLAVLLDWNLYYSVLVSIPVLWGNYGTKFPKMDTVSATWYGALLILWTVLEPVRLLAGRFGNRDGSIAALLMFLLLTATIDLGIMIAFAIVAPRRNALDKSAATLLVIFAGLQLGYGLAEARRMVRRNTVSFYSTLWVDDDEEYLSSLHGAAEGRGSVPGDGGATHGGGGGGEARGDGEYSPMEVELANVGGLSDGAFSGTEREDDGFGRAAKRTALGFGRRRGNVLLAPSTVAGAAPDDSEDDVDYPTAPGAPRYGFAAAPGSMEAARPPLAPSAQRRGSTAANVPRDRVMINPPSVAMPSAMDSRTAAAASASVAAPTATSRTQAPPQLRSDDSGPRARRRRSAQ